MKTTIRKSTYKAIYRLLNRVSPQSYDCGNLCEASCCNAQGEHMGIYLYPGEEKLFTRKEAWLKWEKENAEDYEFPDSWKGKIYFVKCTGVNECIRELRPLQCRVFPITPHISKDNSLVLIRFVGALPYSCPLISDKMILNQDFLKATHTVFKRLIKDQLIFDLILFDSKSRIINEDDILFK